MELEIVHKELSYKIVGILFDVYNELGPGYQENYYQRAIRQQLIREEIPFLEQVRTDVQYRNKFIGRCYIDFVIDHKVVLEIKSKSFFSRKDSLQVFGYLKQCGLQLGILANFSQEGLKYKRILKGYD